mgnify:FL=1
MEKDREIRQHLFGGRGTCPVGLNKQRYHKMLSGRGKEQDEEIGHAYCLSIAIRKEGYIKGLI